ncbi:MAG: hypothetical protein LR008_03255 [Candidatus Pacebacteria bacterium]|nr:hypothetical protein [Candidatus Paceibacterota bacterium]
MLIPLLILTVVASYYRFLVLNDHPVAYEGFCDPYTEECFVGCEDDECLEESYYTEVERYAPTLLRLCGDDISDCEAANTCTENEDGCSVAYCEPEVDGEACDTLSESDNIDI